MTLTLSYLLFLGVISSQFSYHSLSYVYTVVNGSLIKSWKLNFTIYTRDFQGIVIFCIDSEMNEFELKISQNKPKISKRFNERTQHTSVKELCGCYPCVNIMMKFYIEWFNNNIDISCNFRKIYSWELQNNEDKYDRNIKLPSLIFRNNKILIMLGNVGPIIYDKNKTILPFLSQMVGCLDTFYYNDKALSFIEEGEKFQETCPTKCFANKCINGSSKNRIGYFVSCDFRFAAYVGPYCNKSMTSYNNVINYFFEILTRGTNINIKFTWTQIKTGKQALFEVIERYGYTLIWTDSKYLYKNDTVILQIKSQGINIINICVTKNNFKLNNSKLINYTLDNNTKINLGYSIKRKSIDVFLGMYDFQIKSENIIPTDSEYTLHKTIIKNAVWIFIVGINLALSIIIILSISLVVVLLKRRNIVTNGNEIEITVVGSSTNLDEPQPYSYIDNTDVYMEPTNINVHIGEFDRKFEQIDGEIPDLPPRNNE